MSPLQRPSLFSDTDDTIEYVPRPAALFQPQRIILAKGSVTTPARRRLVDRIASAYPRAAVEEQLETPHNKIDLGTADPLELHYRGRRTLVLAEHKSAVGRSDESGNTCPNFWHFSPYGFCPYGCRYCYLAGTQGVRFSPTVKVFVNLDDILAEVDRTARRLGREESFYLGKLQDGMALDPVTGYSRVMIPFFARHPLARLRVLSKSADFDNVLDLDHRGRTVLCWSLNPPAVRDEYETVTPAVAERVRAAERCAAAGYPVRVMLMPVIPIPNWERHYDEFLEDLLTRVPVDRLTIGGVCSYGPALDITGRKVGADDLLSRSLTVIGNPPGDGRARYPYKLRRVVYAHLLGTIRRVRPQQTVALCMEDPQLAADLGVADNIGRCNCIL